MKAHYELPMSCGTCCNVVRKMSKAAQPTIAELWKELIESSVVNTDGTTARVNGNPAYVRNLSTPTTEVLVPMNSKSIEAWEAIDFLEAYTGILVHDHETAMYHFGGSDAECNVHVDRYLKGIIELAESQWASVMRALLYEIKDATEQNGGALSESTCAEYSEKYDNFLVLTREENKSRTSEFIRDKALKLINRLEKNKEPHLLFMRDPNVPFDNNQSERALRQSKNPQQGHWRISHIRGQ